MSFEARKQKNNPENKEAQLPPIPDNHYDILGILPEASENEIKSAHRKRVFTYSTDRPENQGKTNEWMIAINNAADVLLDPEKRAKYDRYLSYRNKTPSSFKKPPVFSEVESKRLKELALELLDLEYEYEHPSIEDLASDRLNKSEELLGAIIKIYREIGQIQGMPVDEIVLFIKHNLDKRRERRSQQINKLYKLELENLEKRIAELKKLRLIAQQSLQQIDNPLDRIVKRAEFKQLEETIRKYNGEIKELEDTEIYLREFAQ